MQRLLRRRQVLDVGRAGIAGPHQSEDASAGRRRRLDQRLERVRAEQRVGGEGIGAQPGTGPQGVGVSPTRAWA